ncbi:hypothetical protein KKA85_09430, partial [bacterium]|nr:hypothetical protein [bacterium]
MPARRPRPPIIALTALLAAASGCILDADPPNLAPVIEALNAMPALVEPDSSSVVTAQASDPEGAGLDYRWNTTAGCFTAGFYEAIATWQAPSYAGPCTLTVVVDDGRDESTATLVVTVALHPYEPHLVVAAPERHFGLAGARLP